MNKDTTGQAVELMKPRVKIYLVENSLGQWSDHRSYVSAVFDNKIDADVYATKIGEFYENIKRSEPPHNPDDYLELNEEKYKELSEWQNLKYEADDFNSAVVIEMEVGEIEKRFAEQNDDKQK